jgi:hypothetical protein
MWPFSMLRQRRDRRRYNAAMFIHLGAYVYSTLSNDDRARVESKVTDLIKKGGWIKAAHVRYAQPDYRAFVRARAMQRLGVPVPVAGVAWDALMPRHDKPSLTLRFFDYRAMSAPAMEALAFLRANGLDVPTVLHDPYNEAHPPPPVI